MEKEAEFRLAENDVDKMRVYVSSTSYFQVLDKQLREERVDSGLLSTGNALSVCNAFYKNVSKYNELLTNSKYRESYLHAFQEFPITVETISLCRTVGATLRR